MELLWFLRPRFCIRYLHIVLTFTAFSVFLVFFHQFRPKGTSEYGSSSGGAPSSFPSAADQHHFGGFFAGLRAGSGYLLRGAIGTGGENSGGSATTGVLPVVYSQSALGTGNRRVVKKRCSSVSTGGNDEVAVLLHEILPDLPVGRARTDNRRLVCANNILTHADAAFFVIIVLPGLFFAVENLRLYTCRQGLGTTRGSIRHLS